MNYLDASEWELALKEQGADALFGPLMRSWRQEPTRRGRYEGQRALLWRRLLELVEMGADPAFVGGRHRPAALFEAASSGSVEAVELCARAAGPNWPSKVDAPDLSGYYGIDDIARHQTCLADCWLAHRAGDENKPNGARAPVLVAKRLLELGANPNGHPKNPGHPLIHAAAFGDVEMVLILIEAGADPRAKNEDGAGVLSVLLERSADESESFFALIKAGFDPDERDNKGRSCFDTAHSAQSAWVEAWLERESLKKELSSCMADRARARL